MKRCRFFQLAVLSTLALVIDTHAQSASAKMTGQTSADSPVRITFVAQSDSFASAVREYEQIWAVDGKRMVATMERIAGLSFRYAQFQDTAITATVLERASSSGFRDRSVMELRASYSADTKRATLVHELGHRLMAGLYRRDEEEHGPLFLWIYDVWVALYGQSFADEQVAVERKRGGPYPAAWDAALKLSAAERAVRWRGTLSERVPERR